MGRVIQLVEFDIKHPCRIFQLRTASAIRENAEGGAMLPTFHLIKAIRIHWVKCCQMTSNLTSPSLICICRILKS